MQIKKRTIQIEKYTNTQNIRKLNSNNINSLLHCNEWKKCFGFQNNNRKQKTDNKKMYEYCKETL